MENGNRLAKMVLSKPSIPYSLKIDGEWCRIIHNDQQRVCSNCHALGHSRMKCPEIVCRICEEKGHLSYDCVNDSATENVNTEEEIPHAGNNFHQPKNQPEENLPPTDDTQNTEPNITEDLSTAIPLPGDEMTEESTTDLPRTGTKRHLPDSDSDNTNNNTAKPQRRSRIKPSPNLAAERPKKEKKDSSQVQQVQ